MLTKLISVIRKSAKSCVHTHSSTFRISAYLVSRINHNLKKSKIQSLLLYSLYFMLFGNGYLSL